MDEASLPSLTAQLTKEEKENYQERWTGFDLPVQQAEVLTDYDVEYYPDTNTDMTKKIQFTIQPGENLVYNTMMLNFTLNIYKSFVNNVLTPFAAADAPFLRKVALRNNFILNLIKGIKVYPNFEWNNQTTANNSLNTNEKNEQRGYVQRFKYPTAYLNNIYLPQTANYRVDSAGATPNPGLSVSRDTTLAHMTDPSTPIIADTTAGPTNYQALNNTQFFIPACSPSGYSFSIPLYYFEDLFELQEYFGKNLKLVIILELETNSALLFENMPPTTAAEITAMNAMAFRLNNPTITANEVKVTDAYAFERKKFLDAFPNTQYNAMHKNFWEVRSIDVPPRAQTLLVPFNTFKQDSLTPHTVCVFLYCKDQAEHSNFRCRAPRNMAQQLITTVTFNNVRVNFLQGGGSTFTYDFSLPKIRKQLYREYLSFVNDGTNSENDMRNQILRFTNDYVGEISATENDYWLNSYNEALAFDLTADKNRVIDMDSPNVLGSSNASMSIKFNTPISNAIVRIDMLHKSQFAITGQGFDENLSLQPKSLGNT